MTAWVIIQIIDVVGEPLSLPEWLDTVVIVLLAVGFPIALIFAWAFELTSDGVVRDRGTAAAQVPAPESGAESAKASTDTKDGISKSDEAIDRLRTAMRLNPHHPDWYLWSLGEAQYYAEHYDDALASMLKITQTSNAGLTILASVYVRLGRVDEARALVATFQTNNPDFSLAHFEQSRGGKFKQRADLDRMIDDLRVAGMR